MKTGKKVAVLAAAAAVALSLAGCSNGGGGGTTDDAAGAGGEGDITVALVSKGFQHQFWQAVKQGAEQRAEELGINVTFDGPAAETEIDGQLQMLQAAIDKGPDAIGFAALDPEACIPLYDTREGR